MTKCSKCGSYAINHHLHGRDGSDNDLCDICYWRKRADYYYNRIEAEKIVVELRKNNPGAGYELPDFIHQIDSIHTLLESKIHVEIPSGPVFKTEDQLVRLIKSIRKSNDTELKDVLPEGTKSVFIWGWFTVSLLQNEDLIRFAVAAEYVKIDFSQHAIY